jgi:hypothetical protein
MFSEKVVIDRIEILEDGQIQVRQASRVYRDDKKIAETYFREVLAPGDILDKQDEKVKAIAMTIWTEDVVNRYKESLKDKNKIIK